MKSLLCVTFEQFNLAKFEQSKYYTLTHHNARLTSVQQAHEEKQNISADFLPHLV